MQSPQDLRTLLAEIGKLKDKAVMSTVQRAKTKSIIGWIKHQWNDGMLKLFLTWIAWLLTGTIFYAKNDFNGSYAKGFYMSVNVGYSIGDGVLKEDSQRSELFSTFYLLFGATTLSVCLAYYIQLVVQLKEDYYNESLYQEYVYQSTKRFGVLSPLCSFLFINAPKISHVIYWLIYIVFGTVWSYYVIGWTLIDGLYFSTSTLSTGGLWGIPPDSPEWVFFFVGLYAATGIPVMGMAIGDLSTLIIEANNQRLLTNIIKECKSSDLTFIKNNWLSLTMRKSYSQMNSLNNSSSKYLELDSKTNPMHQNVISLNRLEVDVSSSSLPPPCSVEFAITRLDFVDAQNEENTAGVIEKLNGQNVKEREQLSDVVTSGYTLTSLSYSKLEKCGHSGVFRPMSETIANRPLNQHEYLIAEIIRLNLIDINVLSSIVERYENERQDFHFATLNDMYLYTPSASVTPGVSAKRPPPPSQLRGSAHCRYLSINNIADLNQKDSESVYNILQSQHHSEPACNKTFS